MIGRASGPLFLARSISGTLSWCTEMKSDAPSLLAFCVLPVREISSHGCLVRAQRSPLLMISLQRSRASASLSSTSRSPQAPTAPYLFGVCPGSTSTSGAAVMPVAPFVRSADSPARGIRARSAAHRMERARRGAVWPELPLPGLNEGLRESSSHLTGVFPSGPLHRR